MKEKYYNTEQEKVYHLQLLEAIELIKYFVKRVEEGSIRSKTTYKNIKNF